MSTALQQNAATLANILMQRRQFQAQQQERQQENERSNRLSDLQFKQAQNSVNTQEAQSGALRQVYGAATDQDAYVKQMQQAREKEETQQIFDQISRLKAANAAPEAITAWAKQRLASNPKYADIAQYVSFLDDTAIELTRPFKDNELRDPMNPAQFLPAGTYKVKGKATGDINNPYQFVGVEPIVAKPDPEAMLDKRFKNQQEMQDRQFANQQKLTQQQIDAADRRANKKDAAKPLPVSALKLQQESTDAIGTASGIRADLGVIRRQVESGALKLGPVRNLAGAAANAAGMSTENSRNLATFKTTLEKLRNDSLRLNKGVQTDGDAQRAWNELMTNINDPGVVKQRLAEIDRINERAVTLHQANIDNIRNNYGQAPLDTSAQTNVKPALGKPATATSKQAPKLSKKAQSIADRY